jgi:hypothetical protein
MRPPSPLPSYSWQNGQPESTQFTTVAPSDSGAGRGVSPEISPHPCHPPSPCFIFKGEGGGTPSTFCFCRNETPSCKWQPIASRGTSDGKAGLHESRKMGSGGSQIRPPHTVAEMRPPLPHATPPGPDFSYKAGEVSHTRPPLGGLCGATCNEQLNRYCHI